MEGNQMMMREALLKLRAEIGLFYKNEWIPYDAWEGCDDVISRALSAPPRQCDIGTAEEQAERQMAYCRKHFTPDRLGGNCRKCPLKDRRGWSCQLAWAQMPYEAEEGAAHGEA